MLGRLAANQMSNCQHRSINDAQLLAGQLAVSRDGHAEYQCVSPPTVPVWDASQLKPLAVTFDMLPPVDVILLTVNDNEYNAVVRRLQPISVHVGMRDKTGVLSSNTPAYSNGLSVNVLIGKYATEEQLLDADDMKAKLATVAVVRSEQGYNKPNGAQNVAAAGLMHLKPSAIIAVGVLFGRNPKNQRLGDVLIAKQLIDYEHIRTGNNSQERGSIPDADASLLQNLQTAGWRYPHPVPYQGSAGQDVFQCKATPATVLSGMKLMDDPAGKLQLFARFPQADGGDMEALGVYSAASPYLTRWAMVKAICDWGDGRKNKVWQAFAAEVAADYLQHQIGNVNFLTCLPTKQDVQNDITGKLNAQLKISREIHQQVANLSRRVEHTTHIRPEDLVFENLCKGAFHHVVEATIDSHGRQLLIRKRLHNFNINDVSRILFGLQSQLPYILGNLDLAPQMTADTVKQMQTFAHSLKYDWELYDGNVQLQTGKGSDSREEAVEEAMRYYTEQIGTPPDVAKLSPLQSVDS